MSALQLDELAHKAKVLYETRLRGELDRSHRDEFVAIEPESGEYFLGKTLSEAVGAARAAHPNRLAHTMRIGRKATLHFGMGGR